MFHQIRDIVIFCLFFLSSSRAVFEITDCHKTAKRGDGLVCYKIFKTKNNFESSVGVCDNNNMKLATVGSDDEYAAVMELLRSSRDDDVWIGLKQFQTPWKWSDGSELKEQGCFLSVSTTNHDTRLMATKTGDNSALSCSTICSNNKYNYTGLRNTVECYCGDSFGVETQNGAQCDMPCPGSSTENCGGLNSERIVNMNGLYSNWLNGQPNNGSSESPENQACATIVKDQNGGWGDVNCMTSLRAVCEIGLSSSFPTCDNATQEEVHKLSYKDASNQDTTTCIYISSRYENYLNAIQTCNNVNGNLIKITSQSHNDALFNVLNNFVKDGSTEFWIGLSRINFRWTTGDILSYTKFTSLSYNKKELCAIVRTNPLNDNNEPYIWSLDDCASSKVSLCQSTNATYIFKPTYFMPTTTTTTLLPTKSIVPGQSTTLPQVNITVPDASFVAINNNKVMYAAIGGSIGGVVLVVIVTIVIVVVICKKKHKMPAMKADVERTKSVFVEPTYFFGASIENETTLPSSETKIEDTSATDPNNQPDLVISSSPPPY
ncbi:hypothetical protein HELRODRAFT_189456 [Helobdella robusta]|uniref:C-type lectin domain-containing protein n=1 Tax=Helobdella robusta TaxID=6412 RepID=T1FR28_HELRO|nr:hypothetical protein HELRODRAFT_189456 [Helobdella robusta]ESN94635.1 hypothetical protein HELRODRAFT_189456 [Helobdella robusta]